MKLPERTFFLNCNGLLRFDPHKAFKTIADTQVVESTTLDTDCLN